MKTRLLLLAGLFSSACLAQTIELEEFASGFSSPIEIANAGDDRLFVVEKEGTIKVLNADGTVNPEPFLTVSVSSIGERGLLGLAFHPDYAENGYFYINYTNESGATVVARHSDPAIAAGTPVTLLTIPQTATNHNGGCIRFGPDGYLYISRGDGANSVNGQDTNVLLGKILRIDVNSGTPYSSPATNPFVGSAGSDEIWAYGLRNPWKFSFNRLNGDLWIADVGEGTREEINKVPGSEAGVNYGWRCYEGTLEGNMSQCDETTDVTMPFTEYPNTGDVCSITGGFLYTGELYPNLQDIYVFSDFCTGDIGLADSSGEITWQEMNIGNVATFGEDANGEIYVASMGGTIYKVTDTSTAGIVDYNATAFTIYPNPAVDAISIRNKNGNYASQVYIYDLSGKMLLNKNLDAVETNTISTDGLPTGFYMMAVTDENGSKYNYKFTIK